MSTPERIQCTIDSVSFSLLEAHDFGWLRNLGTVFSVFDQQDSGTICFGLEKAGHKRFVKYAGARTIDYAGSTAAAVQRLKAVIPTYCELKHPVLVSLESHLETDGGIAALFEWFDGEGLHPHWEYPPPAKYTDPRSPFYRFRHLTVAKRLKAFDAILDFHAHVETLFEQHGANVGLREVHVARGI